MEDNEVSLVEECLKQVYTHKRKLVKLRYKNER
jgi:hypothetical protein